MASDKSIPTEVKIGVPLAHFMAAIDAIEELQRTGKFQIFVAAENAVRFVGETDEFRLCFGKKLDSDAVDKKEARACLEEVQSFLQVTLATGRSPSTIKFFETHVFEEEFESHKDDEARLAELKVVLQKKIELVSRLASDVMLGRVKRLATIVGPILEELDVEIVSRRKSLTQGLEIDSPFLRLRVRYSMGGENKFPFSPPPWIVNPPRDLRSFDLECDESDIDLLMSRLLQAKELLRKAIDARVPTEETKQ